MDKKQTGVSAFPRAGFEYLDDVTDERVVYLPESGMSLRDYFAAKALAALMPVYWDVQDKYKSPQALVKCQVEAAYEYADAMLKERDK